MADWGRIHSKFWKHRKVEAVLADCGLAGIGLWTMANAWSRDNRTAGFIPTQRVEGWDADGAAVRALLDVGLWVEAEGGYRFNDWEDWNGDLASNTLAERLVNRTIPGSQPEFVRRRLMVKTQELLDEGIEPAFLERALKVWLSKPDAGVGLLPFLVSELQREHTEVDLYELLRECYRTGDIKPLTERGYVFMPPDPPSGLKDISAIREFQEHAKKQWIEQLQRELGKKAS